MILPRIVVLTYIPSPYQVELFDALAHALNGQLGVIYVHRRIRERQWIDANLSHEHCFLNEKGLPLAKRWVRHAELAVFSGYLGRSVQGLLGLRHQTRRPWAFWGERPGAKARGSVGRIVRAVFQRKIRAAGVPIWGIGAWAVEGYKQEIGENRLYLNVPYFSNLDRFLAIDRSLKSLTQPVRFLFSGSLIERKGVDILAEAFTRLVTRGVEATLTFVGSGPLEAKLRKLTSSVAAQVEFLGFRQWDELPAIYARADVLCAPSRYDGWGLIVPEGLAAGMPVIASNMMGAARELITGENGWLVRAGSLDDLMDAMRQAARQLPSARIAASTAGRADAIRQNLGMGVRRFEEAIEQSLAECARLGMNGGLAA